MTTRRLNARQINSMLAGFMGFALALAVAFFVVAMPEDIFEGLVAATGLPQFLTMAEPPLGQTARMTVAALTGSLAGMLVIALFLWTGRKPEKKADIVRPFSAGGDFVPLGLAETVEARPLRPALSSREEDPVSIGNMAVVERIVEEPAPAEIETETDRTTPIFLDFTAIRAAGRQPGDAAPLDLGQWKMAEPEQLLAAAPRPRPITAPTQAIEQESISALMHRLEAGLERRSERGAEPTEPPAINKSGAGLRSTLDELRKMAVRS